MKKSSCNLHIFSLETSKRKTFEDSIISKNKNEINITFCEKDNLEKFEKDINILKGSSFIYFFKKRFSTYFLSLISVIVIMFALLSSAIYEDLFKKLIFDFPFVWDLEDSISLIFVIIFFFGLLIMPSLLEGERSELKNILSSWFNKDIRKRERIKLAISLFDKKASVNVYNVDLLNKEHWVWRILIPVLLNRFTSINLYIRNDQISSIKEKLEKLDILSINIIKGKNTYNDSCSELLLSTQETKLYSLMQLSSTSFINKNEKTFISLELFEYCGRNFLDVQKNTNEHLISGFQSFINRSFDDFNFIKQDKSTLYSFTKNVKLKNLNEEKKRLAYYLRNHIEECITYFDNPISLLILYYYVKDIVLDEKRTLAILDKFIDAILKKQEYEFIDTYWFKIAGKMFDASTLNSFSNNNKSLYSKLSLSSLNKLSFLFERSGHFKQALLLNEYLFEINPDKYSVNISSLYERMGEFNKAYDSLPKILNTSKNEKPSIIEVRFHQRKAWLIVSQRKEDLKEEGLNALEDLRELLFTHNNDNEPLSLWHYYNILANYSEWDKEYKEAIHHYKKCLSIPTLGAFEYGASFVNMAIAYRLQYLEEQSKDINLINQAIELGNNGIMLKESVGDKDEMPVVLHNQALNILSKMIVQPINEKECLKVIDLTNDALLILRTTNSNKKRAMLLIENIIAKFLVNIDYSKEQENLNKHLLSIDENEFKQVTKIYKEFYTIKKIDIIPLLNDSMIA